MLWFWCSVWFHNCSPWFCCSVVLYCCCCGFCHMFQRIRHMFFMILLMFRSCSIVYSLSMMFFYCSLRFFCCFCRFCHMFQRIQHMFFMVLPMFRSCSVVYSLSSMRFFCCCLGFCQCSNEVFYDIHLVSCEVLLVFPWVLFLRLLSLFFRVLQVCRSSVRKSDVMLAR